MDADKLRELSDRLLICGNDCSDVLLDGAAEIERLRVERDRLRAQMPAEMKNCTIVFRECPEGHGRLTATNWVQHSCLVCENKRLTLDTTWQDHADHWQKRAMEAEARVAEYAPLQPPSDSGREVFESVVKNNPDADMRAVPNEWVTNQRTITEEVAAKLEARVAELTSLLMEAVNEMEPDIEAKYANAHGYPSMDRKYEQDMDLPRRIRAALAKAGE